LLNNDFLDVGFGLLFKPGPFQWYLLFDHIPLTFDKEKNWGVPVPMYAKAFSFRIGLNLVFGCNPKKAATSDIPLVECNASHSTNRFVKFVYLCLKNSGQIMRLLLKFFLYFILFYYLYRIIDRALFGDRREAERLRKRQQKEWEKFYRTYKKKEGTVIIDTSDRPPKRFKKDEGEYGVDEEVI
jgi:hypothetical protein